MKKRDSHEIIKDIVLAVRDKRGKVRPTHIMYKANLSHQMLKEYLLEVIGKGLVEEKEEKEGKKTYHITKRGNKFLSDYDMVQKFMDSYGLD